MGIEIPAHLIARLLAGDITHEDMAAAYNEDLVKRLKIALEQGEEIVGCEYIRADGKSREYDRILFRYGPPRLPVISDPKKRGGWLANRQIRSGRLLFRWLSGLYRCARRRAKDGNSGDATKAQAKARRE